MPEMPEREREMLAITNLYNLRLSCQYCRSLRSSRVVCLVVGCHERRRRQRHLRQLPFSLSWGRGKELKQAYFPLTACNLLALRSLVHCSPHLSPAIFLCVTLFDQLVEPLKQAIKLAWHFRAPISGLFSSTSTSGEALGIFRRTIRPTVFGNLFLLHYYFVYAESDTGERVEVAKMPNSLYLHSGAR